MERATRQQQMPDPKKIRESITTQCKRAKILLAEAFKEAKDILKNGGVVYDATAVVNLAVILFQISMSKEQGLMKAKQIEEVIKQQKKRRQGKVEDAPAPFMH